MRYLTRIAQASYCLVFAYIFIIPQSLAASPSTLGASASGAMMDAPGVPTLLSPLNGAYGVATTVELQFSSVDGATRYNVQVATDAEFNTIVYTTNVPAPHTWFTAPTPNITYYWRAQASNTDGLSEYSAPWHFSLASKPEEPDCDADVTNLVWPGNGVYGVPDTTDLEFSTPSGATRFNIEVATDKYFKNIVFSMNVPHSPVKFIAPTDSVYYWHVQTVGSGGMCDYSQTWWFSNMPEPTPVIDPPTLLTPINGATVTPNTALVFEPVIGATRYNVQVATDYAFRTIVYSTNVPAGHTTFTAPSDGLYYWRAQAVTSIGQMSHFSTPWSFTAATSDEAVLSNNVTVEDAAVPTSYALHEAYPNPFNPSTSITVDVPEATHLKLAVYDVLGHEVMQLASGNVQAGTYKFTVDASDLPSGIYLYRIETPNFAQTRRMVLLK